MPNMRMANDAATAFNFGLACAIPAAFMGRALLNVSERTRVQSNSSITRRIGIVAIGIPIAIGGVALAKFVAGDIALNRQLITIPTVLLGTLAYGLYMSVAVSLKVDNVRVGLSAGFLIAFVLGVFVCLSYFTAYRLWAPLPLIAVVAFAIAYCLACCLLFSAVYTLPYAVATRFAGPQVGAVTGTLMTGMGGVGYYIVSIGMQRVPLSLFVPVFVPVFLTIASVTVAILVFNRWLPLTLYPFTMAWNTLIQRIDEQAMPTRLSQVQRHSAFWDEHQRLRLFGLDEYVVSVVEYEPETGQAALDYLSTSSQSWAARAAQIELDARQLARCRDVESISTIHHALAAGELEGSASALLRTFSRLSSDVDVALSQVNRYNRRMALSAIADELNGLLRELTRSDLTYAGRFRPIAEQWRRTVSDHMEMLAQTAERNQEIDNPYVVGVPLTHQQEIFVGRTDIIARIEELLAAQDYPPLLLYGQRRMGKTSLLHNLKWLLPFRIIALFVDLQGPVSNASNHAGFLYNIAKLMTKSAADQGVMLPELGLEALNTDPFTLFDDWLDEVERAIVAQGRETILLTMDEFEALDNALTRGRFDEEAVLGTLRHIVQYRTRFKVLLAGSHTLEEFHRWSSYLINAQTIHLGYLHQSEAAQLVERPIKDFALRYQPDARQLVLALTRGHPYLVQLLCAEIVNLKNEQAPDIRRLASVIDVQEAVSETLMAGDQFFMDIKLNQIAPESIELLCYLAQNEHQKPVNANDLRTHFPKKQALANTLSKLVQRELLEEVDGHYSFQVELIRLWFAKQAHKL